METTNLTLTERLRARLEGRKIKKNEKGLALLDVLIGVAIFALVAVIAVAALSQYRARAYESGAVSDARQIGIAMETAYTEAATYPPAADVEVTAAQANSGSGFYAAEGVKLTRGNAVTGYGLNATGTTFTLCVEHDTGAWARYDSAQGGVTAKGREGGCPAA